MPSPRKSLTEAFPGLNIGRTASTASRSSTSPKKLNLAKSLSKAFSMGWPHSRSIKHGNDSMKNVEFTVRLADQLRAEATELGLKQQPAAIITKARAASQRDGAVGFSQIWEELEKSLVMLVYGSNYIEFAGTSLQITIKLCRDVFRGVPVQVEIDNRDPTYQDHLENLSKTSRAADNSSVIRARKEVVFHAKALNYMVDRIVLDSEAWSENLIKKTHAIMCGDLYDANDDFHPGQYRDHEVAVAYSKTKSARCMRAAAVPAYMNQMILDLNNDITKAESDGVIDPYTLAARYHHQFVVIHPFADGNGRLSRVIMNVLLLKYAGHVSRIGCDENRDTYLAVVRRCCRIFNQEDMEVPFEERTCHQETARFLLAKSKENLENMWEWASRRGRSSSPHK